MNRYQWRTKLPKRIVPITVGDRVRANMEHPQIKNIPSREELRGVVVKESVHTYSIDWEGILGAPVRWNKEWVIHE